MLTENPTATSLSEHHSDVSAFENNEPLVPAARDSFDQHETTPVNRRSPNARVTPWPVWFTVSMLVATTVLHAIPWLFEGYVWCGWLGIAAALAVTLQGGVASRLWVLWLCGSCALGAAFHWSPAAMAYTLSSGYALGLAVALPLILWDGLRLALGYWLATKLTRDVRYFWLAAATTTIALEYLMPGVFPWKLGFSQLSSPWLIQAVDIFGASYSTLVAFAFAGVIQIAVTGVVRWFAAGNRFASVPRAVFHLRTVRRLAFAPVVLFLVGNSLYSAFAWRSWSDVSATARKIQVGLVQVDPSFVESTANARAQTMSIAARVDLMCWPESTGGHYDLQLKCLANEERVFQMSRAPERGLRPWPAPNCELLLGGKNYIGAAEQPDELYVTAMLVDRDETITSRYNKRFLMPFGEYVPGEDYVPGLAELFDMDEHIQPGTTAQPLVSSTGARIGAMLCYEDMVPEAARELVAGDANLLVSLINGSAFESPYTLYQHRLISHLRAIECRRYFLRCAATGETCVINPLGEVESRLPMQVNGALVSEVGLFEGPTFYSRFPWLLPILGGGLLALFLRSSNAREITS